MTDHQTEKSNLQRQPSPAKKQEVLSNEGIDEEFEDLIVKKTNSFVGDKKTDKKPKEVKSGPQSKTTSVSPERKKNEPKKIAFGTAYVPKEKEQSQSPPKKQKS